MPLIKLFMQLKNETINIKRDGGDIMKTFRETKKAGFKRTVTLDDQQPPC